MALKLAGHLFTGPFPIDTTIVRANQQPVVFAVIAKGGPGWAPTFRVIDVGSSEDAGIDFPNHPARSQWNISSGDVPSVYLLYLPRSQYSNADRCQIADEIRRKYDPPKGMIEA
jgi:hypothetical protein